MKIYGLILNYDNGSRQYVNGLNYQEEMDFLVAHEKRNKFIVNLFLSYKDNTLCLFQYVEKHGAKLYANITKKAKIKKYFMFTEELKQTIEKKLEKSLKNLITVIVDLGMALSVRALILGICITLFLRPNKSRIRNSTINWSWIKIKR